VWFVLLCSAWAIAPAAHAPGSTGPLLGLHALALAATAAPGLLAYRELRRLRRLETGDPAGERARFLAGMALALSALAVLLVLASAVPLVILAPGAEP
jgi:hypothetical protein